MPVEKVAQGQQWDWSLCICHQRAPPISKGATGNPDENNEITHSNTNGAAVYRRQSTKMLRILTG